MTQDVITVSEVAKYLKLNERTIYRLAQEGKVPAAKIAGQWRFRRDVIDEWLASQMRQFAASADPSSRAEDDAGRIRLREVVRPEAIDLKLQARDREEALRALVDLAAATGRVKLPGVLLRLLRDREDLHPTGTEAGLALPHPRHMLSGVVHEPVVAIARSDAGVRFGATDGQPTRLFVMACSPSDRTHLRLLSKLARLLSKEDFRSALMSAETPASVAEAFAASPEQ